MAPGKKTTAKQEPSKDSVPGSAFLPASTGPQEERKPEVFIHVLVNSSGKFDAAKFDDQLYLVGQLKDVPGKWALPGGPVPFFQTIESAAVDYVNDQMGFDVTPGDAGTGQGYIFKTVASRFWDSEGTFQHLVVIFVVCNWTVGMSSEPLGSSPFILSSRTFSKWDIIQSRESLFEPLKKLKYVLRNTGAGDVLE